MMKQTTITAEEMARIAAIAKAQYNKLNGAFFRKNRETERRLAKQALKDKEEEESKDDNDEILPEPMEMTDEVCVDVDDFLETKIEKVQEVKSEFIAVVIKEEPTDYFEFEATVKIEDAEEPPLLIEMSRNEVEDKKISAAFVLLTRLEPEEISLWTKVKQEPELEALREMFGDESDREDLVDDFFVALPPVKKTKKKRNFKKPTKNSYEVRYGRNPLFDCDKCERKCLTRTQMSNHMKNHHLSEKFPCSECSKTFHNSGEF